MEPILLSDKSRLQEIFDLRVLAWENSPDWDMVNRQQYPNGLMESLDDTGLHWIIENTDNTIISSARLNFIKDINEVCAVDEYTNKKIDFPEKIGYISRLVTHPLYRGLGLSYLMDKHRINYAIDSSHDLLVVLSGDLGLSRFSKMGFNKEFSFLDKSYKTNLKNAYSHLMTLNLKGRSKIV